MACVLAMISGGVVGMAHGQPTTWDGDAGDGLWISQQNWDTDVVPGSSSEVMIPSDAGTVQIILSGESCTSVSCLSSLRLTSGTLEVSGLSTVSNMVFDGGGFTPTLDIGGDFIISGSSSCSTGQVIGSGEFKNSGVFNAMSFGVDGVSGASATNNGTWIFLSTAGSLSLNNNALFSNQGTFTLTQDSVITGASGLFSNEGMLSRTGGVGSATIDTGFTQLSGTMSVSGVGASIALLGDGWQMVAGTVEVSDSGRISLIGSDLARTRTLGVSAITGTGTVDIFPNNSTIDWINTTTTNVNVGGVAVHSGTMNLSGDLTNNGLFEGRGASMSGTGSFINSAIGTLSIPTSNGFEFKMNATSSGVVDVHGSLILSDGAVFNHLFNIAGQLRLYDQSVVGTLSPANPGVLRSSGKIELMGNASGLVVSTISSRLETSAGSTIHVNNGTLVLGGGGSLSDSLIRIKGDQSAATLWLDGQNSWSVEESVLVTQTAGSNATVMNFGVINSAGPSLSIASSKEFEIDKNIVANLYSSNFTGGGTLNNNAQLNWYGGTLGCLVNNRHSMDILPGIVGKTLSGELMNGDLGGTVNQSSGITLDGGTISNHGLWIMSAGSSINPFGAGGAFHNTENLWVSDTGGATHVIGVDLNNTGAVSVLQGHLVLTGDVLQLNQLDGTLSGGQWTALAGTTITFPRSLVQLRGPANIEAGGSEMPGLSSLSSIDNAGVARLLDTAFNGDLGLSGGSELTAAGNVTVNGDYTSTGGSKTTIEPGAKIEATGSMAVGEVDSAADEINVIAVLARNGAPTPSIVTPLLELWGGIRVGQTGDSVVVMQGDLLMHPLSRLHIKLLSNTSDRLSIQGDATLAGILSIDASEASFVQGQGFTVLSATDGITGLPDQVLITGLPMGQEYAVMVVGNELHIVGDLACPADFTGDGVLNFFDVSAFLQAFGASESAADLNGDGVHNFFDVSAFLQSFAAGCL